MLMVIWPLLVAAYIISTRLLVCNVVGEVADEISVKPLGHCSNKGIGKALSMKQSAVTNQMMSKVYGYVKGEDGAGCDYRK
jgi:hypothetical protein